MCDVSLGVVGGGRGRGVGGGGLVWLLLGVDSGALVGHIGHVAVVSVRGVLHVLDSAIGKSDGVGSLDVGGTIGGLLTVEVGLGVIVSHGVGEGVGGDLVGVLLSVVSRGWLVSWGSVHSVGNNGGSVHGVVNGSVDSVNWGMNSVMDRGMNSVMDWGVDSVVNWGVDSVVDSMSHGGDRVQGDDGGLADWDWPVGSDGGLDLSQTLGVVSLGHGGVCGSEGLALTQGSHLTVSGGD